MTHCGIAIYQYCTLVLLSTADGSFDDILVLLSAVDKVLVTQKYCYLTADGSIVYPLILLPSYSSYY